MNKIVDECMFNFKKVPDIFFMDDNKEIIYYIDSVDSFSAEFLGYGKWEIKITSLLFYQNISNFWNDFSKKYTLYCRTYKEIPFTNMKSDFCFKFNNAMLKTIKLNSQSDENPCNFPITFISDNLELINDKECPKLLIDNDKKIISYFIEK